MKKYLIEFRIYEQTCKQPIQRKVAWFLRNTFATIILKRNIMESKAYFEKVMQDFNQFRNGRSLRKYCTDEGISEEWVAGSATHPPIALGWCSWDKEYEFVGSGYAAWKDVIAMIIFSNRVRLKRWGDRWILYSLQLRSSSFKGRERCIKLNTRLNDF